MYTHFSKKEFCYNAPESYDSGTAIVLNYRKDFSTKNVNFRLPKLINCLNYIPSRFLDLLEIASYVYCADRYTHRGCKNSPYFTGWQREFRHKVFVRDYEFWSDTKITDLLNNLLSFTSGDIHEFVFEPGHHTPKAHMFDSEECWPDPGSASESCEVVMFSGGLDSTSGVLDILNNSDKKIYFASHISSNSVLKTQNVLIAELERKFPERLRHIIFECNLSGERAREGTQRTRSFLYASVGAVVARRYGLRRINFYENGVLSINLPPSEQFHNVRTTRTTHPKTLNYFSRLFTAINETELIVENPFFWMTKADIIKKLKDNGGGSLLNSTVSCSRTFDKGINVQSGNTHCGRCSQCIDRRFGFAGGGILDDENRGLYAYDFVIDNICADNDNVYGREERTMLVDYIRLAIDLKDSHVDAFSDKWLDQLTDVVDYVGINSETEAIIKLHQLFVKHGQQVTKGILEFQSAYSDKLISQKSVENSLSQILSTKEYLDNPALLLSQNLCHILSDSIPLAFQSSKPDSERVIQDHIEAIINRHTPSLKREFPYVSFSLGWTVPDFSMAGPCIYVEVKYARGKTSPSKVNKEISEDFTKYPDNSFLLIVIYDPERKIKDDYAFQSDFLEKRDCLFCIIR